MTHDDSYERIDRMWAIKAEEAKLPPPYTLHWEFSNGHKDNVYLEEDCDLSLLLQRLHSDNVSVKWVTKHTDGDSKIRSYERYAYVQDTNQTA